MSMLHSRRFARPTPTSTAHRGGRLSAMLLLLLLLVGATTATSQFLQRVPPGPLVFELRSQTDDKPLPGVLLRVGGRAATTDTAGLATLDGVPAGVSEVTIHQAGYDGLRQPIVIPPGRREVVPLRITPVVMVELAGSVREAQSKQPVASAHVALRPIDVPSALSASFDLQSGYDGRFVILELPIGRYSCRVDCAGFAPVQREVIVDAQKQPLDLELSTVSDAATLRVLVRGDGGRPLPGAQVTVAEAWPLGILGAAATAADGTAALQLRQGRINWMADDKTCAIARPQVQVRVEAAGHHTRFALATLGAASTCSIDLSPTTAIAEREPNDTPGKAQEIVPDAPVSWRVDKIGDVDWFRFRLPADADLAVEVAAKAPLPVLAQLCDAQGKVLQERVCGRDARLELGGAMRSGTYLVRVGCWGNNAASETMVELTVRAGYAADACEPNDDLRTGRLIQSGQEVRGYVHPVGDVDNYRFELSRTALVRFAVAPFALHPRIAVYDDQGKPRGESVGGPNAPIELRQQLPPGRYVAQFGQWGNGASSLQPYSFRIEVLDDDGIDDPEPQKGSVRAVRTLQCNDTVANTILPVGDIDRYAVSVPSAGVLSVHARSPFHPRVRVLDLRGNQLGECVGPPRGLVGFQCSFAGPQQVVLEFRQWGDGVCDSSPYILGTFFEPADEVDAVSRDDAVADAVPLRLGEVMRGSIVPVGDVDNARVEIDHPGQLRVKGSIPQLHPRVRLLDGDGRQLQEVVGPVGGLVDMTLPVLPGEYIVQVRQWGDGQHSFVPYAFAVWLERADPRESVPLANDPVRNLRVDEAGAACIEQPGDVDRFVVDVPEKGTYVLKRWLSVHPMTRLYDDRTGQKIGEYVGSPGNDQDVRVEATGPTRFRIEQSCWGNAASTKPGYVGLFRPGHKLVGEVLRASLEPTDPTLATFEREAIPGMAMAEQCDVDADGDGRVDLQLPAGERRTHRYAAEGLYRARAVLQGEDGVRSESRAWVEAIGPAERVGVQLVVNHPGEGMVLDRSEPARVAAISYSGARIARIEAQLDGRAVPTVFSSPWLLELPLRGLGGGAHELSVTAVDQQGGKATVARHFTVSDYFDLQPADGASLSGNSVAVSWNGRSFGTAAVRYRPTGSEAWQEVRGQNARDRLVQLPDLEANKPYELQPLGGAEPGPIVTVTRQKGLAFGQSRYAANIRRDYDQRLGISVRNHGEQPLQVRLECGKPPADSKLLVGFVGEGSEDQPLLLQSGEEREFLLALSAQDAMQPVVRFPLRIQSDRGLCDEAEAVVAIQLPEVKLRWEDQGPLEHGLGRKLRLCNDGDGLTDVRVASDSLDLGISPQLEHGFLPAGTALEFVARPRLYEGFQSVAAKVQASAIATTVTHDVALQLAPGDSIYAVSLLAGGSASSPLAADSTLTQQDVMTARALAGAWLNPGYVDWSQRTSPQDTDGDGKPDRWSVDDRLEGILWVGDDSNGDGEVDFVHADIGSDGQFDYSAYRGVDGWEPTNLVDANLEMGFKLPWNRAAYEPHDLDIVLGGKVIGRLRDVVPEGNYTFKLPPDAIPFDTTGSASGGDIELHSKHLRGGHYVVSSDFRIVTRMTATQVFTAAPSQQAAEAQVRATPDLVLDAPDYSVSSAELRVEGDRRVGAPLEFVVAVRNVGAGRTSSVPVALRRAGAGDLGVELARVHLSDVPLSGSVEARIPWTAAAGNLVLHVVVDPDRELGDANADNDIAVVSLVIPGEDAPPTLQFAAPSANAVVQDTVVEVRVEANDDSAVARVELRVDGGLWGGLDAAGPGAFAGRCLLQPGAHTLLARVTDSGGKQTEASVPVQVEAATPALKIQKPEAGLLVHDATTMVTASVGDDASYVAARAGNGPWQQLRVQDGVASGAVEVPFGPQTLEVMASSARGARGSASVAVQGVAQPEAEPPALPPAGQATGAAAATGAPGQRGAPQTIDGLPFDPTGPANTLLQPKGSPAAANAAPTANGGQQQGNAAATDAGGDGTGGAAPASADEQDSSDLEPGSAPATDLQPEALPPVVPDAEPVTPPANAAAPAAPAPAPALTPAAAAASRPPGAFVAAQACTSDWYCTNRPDIAVKFRLPEWLKKKQLNYANKAEYDRMVKKFIDDMKRRGIDTSKLEQFQDLLRKRIGRMDQPGELPGWLESIGMVGPKPENPAELAAWRERMQQAADAWYLRLLSSGDPALVAQGLKARADAIGQFDQAMQESANAAIEQIHANQKLIEDCVETLPVVGDVLDLYAAATGEAALSGDRLSALERALRAASVLGPLGLEQLLKRSPTAQLIAEGLGEMAQSMGKSGKEMLARALKMDPKAVDKGLDAFVDILTKERRLLGESADDAAARAAKEFAKTPAGIADANRMLKDHGEARDLVNALKKAEPGSEEMTRLCRELQSNKTAQALINRADIPDAVRKNVNDQIGGWYKAADKSTSDSIGKLIKEPLDEGKLVRLADDLGISPADADKFRRDMNALAKKNGCSVQDLQVDTMTITNVRKAKPGDMQVSVGRDRDVTFVVKGPDGKVLTDIDHAISKGPYEQGFWKASGKGDLPTTPEGIFDHKAISSHADQLDQCVTSKRHLEAYNTGEVQLTEFLDKSKTPTLTRVEDIKATVAYKSEHWFDKASKCGDPSLASRHTAEGMRQATKQYDDLILSRVRQYGLDPKVSVPAKLQTSMDIMKQVSSGKISPAKADAMLGALGLSKEKVVKNMADYLEAVEKTAGTGFRRIKSAELVNQLARVPGPGSPAWSNTSLQLINGALANGHISGSQFVKLRGETLAGVVQTAKQAAAAGGDYKKLVAQWSREALQRRLISAAEKAALDAQ